MSHFEKLDLVDVMPDVNSEGTNRILAVTETFIKEGDTFCIGEHPKPIGNDFDITGKYQVDSVIDVVEVSFLNYRIQASKI